MLKKKSAKIIRKAVVKSVGTPRPAETTTSAESSVTQSIQQDNTSTVGNPNIKLCAIKGCLNEAAEGSIYCGSCKRDLHM